MIRFNPFSNKEETTAETTPEKRPLVDKIKELRGRHLTGEDINFNEDPLIKGFLESVKSVDNSTNFERVSGKKAALVINEIELIDVCNYIKGGEVIEIRFTTLDALNENKPTLDKIVYSQSGDEEPSIWIQLAYTGESVGLSSPELTTPKSLLALAQKIKESII